MRVFKIKLAVSVKVPMGDGSFRFSSEVYAVASSAAAAIALTQEDFPGVDVAALEVLGDGVLGVFVEQLKR